VWQAFLSLFCNQFSSKENSSNDSLRQAKCCVLGDMAKKGENVFTGIGHHHYRQCIGITKNGLYAICCANAKTYTTNINNPNKNDFIINPIILEPVFISTFAY
jgi:hypothetical protein